MSLGDPGGCSHQTVVAIFIWTVSLVFASFSLTHSMVQRICVEWSSLTNAFDDHPDVIWRCYHNEEWFTKWVVAMIDLCQFCICVIIVSVMSYAISFCLIRGELQNRKTRMRSSATMRARLYLARMVMINALIFFVCLTPFEIVNLESISVVISGTEAFMLSHNVREYLNWIGRVTMMVNSAVNPVIYSAVHPRYRAAVCKAFGCRLLDKHEKPQTRAGISVEQVDKTSKNATKNMTCEITTNMCYEIGLVANTKPSQRDYSLDQNGKSPNRCPIASFSDL